MIPIEALYPELKYIENRQALAHFDLGYQLAKAGLYYACWNQLLFIRLGETYWYSNTMRPYIPPSYFQLAESHFLLADQLKQDILALNVPIQLNLALVRFLLANNLQNRLDCIELLNTLKQKNRSLESLIQSNLAVFQSHLNQFPFPISPQTELGLIQVSMDEFATIPLTTEEMAQSLALRTRILTGYQGDTPCYESITWRITLLRCLIESMHPEWKNSLQIGVFDSDTAFTDFANKQGWQVHTTSSHSPQLPENLDVVTLWHLKDFSQQELLKTAFAALKPEGLLIVAMLRSQVSPEAVRCALETMTDSTCFLLDREAFSDVLLAYVWKGQRWIFERKILMVAVPHSTQAVGGYDNLMYRLQSALLSKGIKTDISMACRLDGASYDGLFLLGAVGHEDGKLQAVQRANKPVVCMPILNVKQEDMIACQRLYQAIQNNLNWELFSTASLKQLRADAIQDPELALTRQRVEKLRDICDWWMPAGRAELSQYFLQEEELPIQILPHACCLFDKWNQATPESFIEAYDLQDFILCLARLDTNKNQMLLAYALRETNIPLVLIGSEGVAGYGDICQKVGNGQVYHLSGLSDHMVASALKAARLLVLPSASEVFPLVVVEAAAAGCPVVVTQNSAVYGIFEDYFYYCDPLSPEHLRQVVLAAYKADNQERIARAQEIARQNCQWEHLADRLANIFQALHAQNHGQPVIFKHGQWFRICQEWQPVSENNHLPPLYQLTDIRPVLQDISHLSEHFEVTTDLEVGYLKQQGFSQVQKRKLSFSEHDEPLVLPEVKNIMFLTFYDSENTMGWRESWQAYQALFSDKDDVILYIYALPNSSYNVMIEEISGAVGENAGAPDVYLLETMLTEEEYGLFQQCRVLAPFKQLAGNGYLLRCLMANSGCLITHAFEHQMSKNTIMLHSFEYLLSLDPFKPIHLGIAALVTAIRLSI